MPKPTAGHAGEGAQAATDKHAAVLVASGRAGPQGEQPQGELRARGWAGSPHARGFLTRMRSSCWGRAVASPAPQVPVLTVTRGDAVASSPAAMSRAGAPRSAWKSRWSLASSFIMGQVPTALGSAPGAADQQNGPPWSGGKIKTNAPHRE